jgi:hydrogenase maturation protease
MTLGATLEWNATSDIDSFIQRTKSSRFEGTAKFSTGMKRILVAGIGNIFFGDDAFGCEVATELAKRPLPEGVNVRDFGIRSYDLAYAMMEDYELIIFIDALSRGEAPGTLYLIEPELNKNKLDETEAEVVNAHSMSPVRVLQLVRSLGGQPRKLYVVGCEPGVLESEDGRMGLSERVAAAVEPAVNMIQKLIGDFSQTEGVEAGLKKVKPDQRIKS